MKAHLMFPDRDFNPQIALPPNASDLMQDLELETLLTAMARGDDFLRGVSLTTILSSLTDPEGIVYRQHVLADFLAEPQLAREMYAIAVDAIDNEKKLYLGLFRQRPAQILHRSVQAIEIFMTRLRQLRTIADGQSAGTDSEGLTSLFAMLRRELDDDYFHQVGEHVARLKFRRGMLMSAHLGLGNRAVDYVLRAPGTIQHPWREWIGLDERSSYSFQIADRDEAGANALAELNDRGLNLVANALAQSSDHILSFFTMLRTELAFYVSCINLHEQLAGKGEPLCAPEPVESSREVRSFDGLYDVCLSLRMTGATVGNSMAADGTTLVVITGANSGGKSTFLRSVGVAQLMMQCGMFVGARSFRVSLCDGTYTHFAREEDSTMSSGRLDDELARMSAIADLVTPHCLVLLNESFSSTNEREGSEIARQVIRALLESRIRVVIVTHLYDLAKGLCQEQRNGAVFLRADRETDGRRSFRLVEAGPLSTSFGEDLYTKIGGWVSSG